MKKKLPAFLFPFSMHCSSQANLHYLEILFSKTKLSFLFLFVFASSVAQTISHTYTTNTSVFVPPGLSTMTVQAWGAGGAGGGSTVPGSGFGRGGAGGGGGAYATAAISVSTLTNTNINVVVGAQTAGTTGNGASGASSTITGFETVILAAGGSGGAANSTGGTPAGGMGGQASASFGDVATKASGGNGDPGGTSLLSLLFSSGKGGNGGAPGGGAGGAAIGSILLGVNSVGNPGTGPGGGGGGAMTAGTTGPLAGGAGAPGQIKIDYTCPTYSITGISAANVCTSSGTSLVTLTGSAASLPVGTYTLTYNRSSPAGSGLTATLNVAVAGTGTFTAVGLTAAGTPTITVTNLTAGECTSTIGSNNIANVTVFGPTAGGAVTGTSPICYGATSGLLTLSGHTGTILNWESSVSPFSTWTNIVNTTATYTSGPLTATTQFRAVVQNGPCASVASTPVTITVNPLPDGTLTANGPFCATGSGQLTFTATAGTGPYTIVYKENGGADRTATNVTSGTPFTTFTTPVTASTTYTLVSVTGANTCVRSAAFTGGSATITVNPLPQGSLTANGPFCATGAGQLTFTATAGTGPYTIVYKENGGADQTATNVTSGTPFATFTTPVIASTTYTLVSVTGANSCVRSAAFTGGSATITVNPLPQGSLTANGPFCATGAGQLTFTATAGTGPYVIVYKENGGADQTATNVTSGTPFATFTTPVTASTTYTLVSVTGANSCVRSSSFTGGSATITVNPLPQGSLTANGPFCATGAGQLIFTATAGTGPYTIVYKENGGADQTATNVNSGTPFATFTTPVIASTTYTLVSVTGANSCVRSSSFTGGSATITVNPLPQGSLTANGPFCATGAGQLTFTATAGTGPYTIVYKENGGADQTATNVASGTPFATFTTPVIASTTYTLVSVTGANTCVRSAAFTGGSATITVNPLPQGSLTANGPFCATGAGQLTFTATAGTGPYTIVYKENGGADQTATNVASGTPFATFTTPVIASTTYTLVSVTGANTCVRSAAFTGGSATITVNPLPQGSLTANGPFCATGAGQLTFTATAGTGPYTIVYKENGGADQTATNVASGTPFATFTTPVIASTTYTLVSITGANTCVRSAAFTGGSATITVNPLPQGSLTSNGPFCETGAGQLTFTATAGTGPYTIVYKENGGADRTATNVTSGSPFATFTTPVIASTTYTLVSVTGANTCVRSAAFTGGSATITVNPLPQGSLTSNGPFCGTGAGQLTFTATAGTGPYTIVYKENGGADRTATNVTSGSPFATFTTPVIASTTYTLVSVTGANTCVRSSSFTGGSATITISPLPTAPINSGVTQPTCSIQTGTIVLTGLPNIINYTITQTGTSPNTYTGGSGADPTTYVITGLAAGTYNFTVQYAGSCVSPPLSNITINPLITNTYTTVGGWSNGTPTINQNVVFADNYSITGDLNSCTCKVNPGIKITVTALNTLTINNALIVDSAAGTELIFENNSSLIQINNNPVINSGNITYKRTAKQILWGDYVYWSTPVSPQKLIDLSPLTLSDKFFGFNGDNWVITSPNDFMTVGKGYIIRGPQTYSTSLRQDYTASFTGVPNNGNLSGENMAAGKFYLIGNPYPSGLDADLFLDENLFLDGTIFLWNHNTPVGTAAQYQYSDDDYASYNTSGGVGTSAKSSPGHTDNPATDAGVKPTGNIAAGQSFFAQATTSGLATFNNTMRIGGASNNQFFKTANTSKKADLERHRLWLNMTNEGGAFKQLLVGYIEEATNGNDNRFDGITLDANPYLDFYSINGTYKYVIQGRALPFSDKDVVPLGYRSAIVSDFTIAIDDSDGDLENQAIYIEDKVTGLVHNLRDSNYTFSSGIGIFDNRFILRYTNTSLGIDEFENSGKEIVISTKDKVISINAPEKTINEILIYDLTGNLIYRKTDLNDPAFQIVNLRSQNQLLLVKVKLTDNTTSTQKVMF